MERELDSRILLFILMVVEMITASVGIFERESTEEISLWMLGIFGIWIVFVLSTFWINSLVKRIKEKNRS